MNSLYDIAASKLIIIILITLYPEAPLLQVSLTPRQVPCGSKTARIFSRWRCSNPDCLYETSESFRFVNKGRKTTNATDMLIVEAYRNLLETSASIAKRFHMSDSYVHEVFDRYVKLDRLSLTDAISIDEVHLDMDDDCKYALVIQDFHTGDPIDLLRSRRTSVTEPYFVSIPASNGPIESINRKVKDLKRLVRGFRNFEHFRNRFLFATRQTPVLNGVTDYNPVTYYEEDDF